MTVEELLGRRIPLAVVVALLVHAGTVVWWAASRDSDLHFQHERLVQIEKSVAQTKEVESEMLARLARIEERISGVALMVDHIDKTTRRQDRYSK